MPSVKIQVATWFYVLALLELWPSPTQNGTQRQAYPDRLLLLMQASYNDLEHIYKLLTMLKLLCLELLWVA